MSDVTITIRADGTQAERALGSLGSSLARFNNVRSEAKPGSPAVQAFKAIGLSVEELRKMDPAEALRVTAVALNGYADDGNKARLVQEWFGKSVREVAPPAQGSRRAGKAHWHGDLLSTILRIVEGAEGKCLAIGVRTKMPREFVECLELVGVKNG